MRAVLLAGGKGKRLAPYTNVLPKPLMPLVDRPILEIVIEQLRYYGFTHITICVGHLASLIQTFFGNGEKYGITIEYIVESEPLGTAGPLSLLGYSENPFIVMNGDILTTLDFRKFYEHHKKQQAGVTIAIHNKSVEIDLGVLSIDATNKVTDYIEKPIYNFPVSTGIYMLSHNVLKYIPKNKYYDFPTLIKLLINRREMIETYPIEGLWLDIGRESDYKKAVEMYESNPAQFIPHMSQ